MASYRHPKRTLVKSRSSSIRRYGGYRSGSKLTPVEAAAVRNENRRNNSEGRGF